MDLYEVIASRRSIRKYKSEMVPEDIVLKVLKAANMAPSGQNLQQWEFLILTGSLKNKLGEINREQAERRMPPAGQRTPQQEASLEFAQTFGGAPLVIVALTETHGDPQTRKMHLESTCAAFAFLLLAATAEGLGTCWMTGLLRSEAQVRSLLAIPANREIVAFTPLGYPDEAPAAKPRKDPELKEKVRWLEDSR